MANFAKNLGMAIDAFAMSEQQKRAAEEAAAKEAQAMKVYQHPGDPSASLKGRT